MQLKGDQSTAYDDIFYNPELYKLGKELSEDDLNRAKFAESLKLPEDESPVMTRMPSMGEAATSGYNTLLDTYAGIQRQQATMTPEERVSDMALNALPVAGVQRITPNGNYLESVDRAFALKNAQKVKEDIQEQLFHKAYPEYSKIKTLIFGGGKHGPLTGDLEEAVSLARKNKLKDLPVQGIPHGEKDMQDIGSFSLDDLMDIVEKSKK